MKKFLASIGRGLAKMAMWCMEHPDQLIAVADAAKKLKDKKS